MTFRRVSFAATAVFVWLSSPGQTAPLFTWVDEQGTVHYSQSLPPQKPREDTSSTLRIPAKAKAVSAPSTTPPTTPPPVAVSSAQTRAPAEARRPRPSGSSKEANRVGVDGVLLIRKGRMDEGLELMKRATQLAPEDPIWHMSYATSLFTRGQALVRAGKGEEGEAVFREVERELIVAMKFFKDTDRLVLSHCYVLLGDVYSVAFQDRAKAKTFYQTALKHNPDHPGALEALKRTAP